MLEAFLKVFIAIVTGIAIAAASSWITVRLSLRRFRSEKWWEKKVAAYERVIDAFHDLKRFTSEHMVAEEQLKEIDDARDHQLRELAQKGRDEILRASDVGAFILSEKTLSILAKYEAESGGLLKHKSWYEYLDAKWSITNQYMKEIIAEAHRDLKR